MKPKMVCITSLISEGDRHALDDIAIKTFVTRSVIIRRAIAYYIDNGDYVSKEE